MPLHRFEGFGQEVLELTVCLFVVLDFQFVCRLPLVINVVRRVC